MTKVKVPKNVLRGITAVRDSGLTNMLDRAAVAQLATDMGYEETACWIGAHRTEYAEGIFRGLEAHAAE